MNSTCQARWPRRRNRRVTLPLAIAALAALCSSTVTALPQPQVTTPASLDDSPMSLVLNNAPVPTFGMELVPGTQGELRIRKRADDDKSTTSLQKSKDGKESAKETKTDESKDASASKTASSEATSTESSDGSSAASPTDSTAPAASSALPQPFDAPVPGLFQAPDVKSNCPNFIVDLIKNPAFQKCYPISMLMQVVDASCAADVKSCTDFMSKAASNMTSDAGCKGEIAANQTSVLQAYRGLRNYDVVYSATCLQDPATSSYCFTKAATNTTLVSDAYLYFMPYGMALPGASAPSCDFCTKQTMGIYHALSAHRSQLVSKVYEDAATQINTLCGLEFVNSTLPSAAASDSSAIAPSGLSMLVTSFAIASLWLL